MSPTKLWIIWKYRNIVLGQCRRPQPLDPAGFCLRIQVVWTDTETTYPKQTPYRWKRLNMYVVCPPEGFNNGPRLDMQ